MFISSPPEGHRLLPSLVIMDGATINTGMQVSVEMFTDQLGKHLRVRLLAARSRAQVAL